MDTGFNPVLSYGKMDELKRAIRSVLLEMDIPQLVREVQVEAITEPEQRIIDAMLWLEEHTGKPAFKKDLVAYFSRHQADTINFTGPKSGLKRKGLMELTYGGHMKLTEAGKAAAKSRIAISEKPEKPEKPSKADKVQEQMQA